MRFYLQSLSALLNPDHRVCRCCKRIAPVKDDTGRWVAGYYAEIRYSPQREKARYRGLELCKNVWICPVCAARIAQQRRDDMRKALYLAQQKGMGVFMLTLTMQHGRADSLGALLATGRAALRRMWSGAAPERFRGRWGVVGQTRSIETPYGVNGWHVHYHLLIFTQSPVAAADLGTMESWYRLRWQESLERAGGFADWEHGAKLQFAESYVAEYVSKFGRMPKVPEWGAENEMSMGAVKTSHSAGKTPFEILYAFGDDYLSEWGDLFVEYAQAMKHERSMYWSKGLALLLGMNEPTPDELITESPIAPDEFTFAYLTPGELKMIVNQPRELRAELLTAAERGADHFKTFCGALGIAPDVYGAPVASSPGAADQQPAAPAPSSAPLHPGADALPAAPSFAQQPPALATLPDSTSAPLHPGASARPAAPAPRIAPMSRTPLTALFTPAAPAQLSTLPAPSAPQPQQPRRAPRWIDMLRNQRPAPQQRAAAPSSPGAPSSAQQPPAAAPSCAPVDQRWIQFEDQKRSAQQPLLFELPRRNHYSL